MLRKVFRPLAVLAVSGVLVFAGCTQSNESAANITGEPAKGVGGAPPPKSQEEYMKQMGQAGGSNPYTGKGYPGRN
jgi:hypothetical protein